MNKKALIIAAVAVLTSGAALADRGDYRSERGDRYERNDRDGRYDRDGRGDRSNRDDRFDRRADNRYDRHDRYDRNDNRRDDYRQGNRYDHGRGFHDGRYVVRGAGPGRNMHRGGYLVREYRDNRYVVSDWHRYRLSSPPRGHHWVRVGDDYVLAAIATGLIANILLNN